MSEHDNDLYWHALNYRTAGIHEAEAMWQELQACVKRLVAAGRRRQMHEDWLKCMSVIENDNDIDEAFHGANRCQRAIKEDYEKLMKEE